MSVNLSEVSDNERLKYLRNFLDIKQGDFAVILEMKQGSYSDIERGQIGISYKTLKKLYEKFKVNPIWIMFGISTMLVEESKPSINTSNKENIISENDPKDDTIKALKGQVEVLKEQIDLYKKLLEDR